MKKVVLTFILSSIFISFIKSQNVDNAIKNGGFEGGVQPVKWAQADNLLHWESRGKRVANSWIHSPDYFEENWTPDLSNNNDGQTSGFPVLLIGPQKGLRYIGLGNYELIQQKHYGLEKNRYYTVSMYINLSTEFPSIWNNSGKFKVFLAKNKVKYQNEDNLVNDLNELCLEPYVSYQNGINQDFLEIGSWELDVNDYPTSDWHRISATFYTPDNINQYDWFVMDCEQLGFDNSQTQANFDCMGDYLYIDEVRMEQATFCESACAQDSLLPIITSTLPNAMYANGNNPSAGITYFKVLVENAVGINFWVFGQNGQVIWEQHAFDPNGLKDVGYSDYLLSWIGEDHSGNMFPQDSYVYRLELWNCGETQTKIYNGMPLTYLQGSGDFTQAPDIINTELNDCCLNHQYFQNITFNSDTRSDVHNFITAGENVTTGPTGYALVGAGSYVLFHAGNEINLEPGWGVLPGGEFDAVISDCVYGSIKSGEVSRISETEYVNVITEFSLFPNPAIEGIFSVSDKKATGRDYDISIYNSLGVLQFASKIKMSKEIDLSDRAPGIYSVVISEKGLTLEVKKVIVE